MDYSREGELVVRESCNCTWSMLGQDQNQDALQKGQVEHDVCTIRRRVGARLDTLAGLAS